MPAISPVNIVRRCRPCRVILSAACAILLFGLIAPMMGKEPVAIPREGKSASSLFVVDDNKLQLSFEKDMGSLMDKGAYTKIAELEKQLERKTCGLNLPAPKTERLTAAEIYDQCRFATVMISTFFHCGDKECKRWHSNIATGFLVSSNGVVISNQHIIGSAYEGSQAVGVRTLDGKVYAVEAVLAADENSDVAIYKLATDRKDFPCAPLGTNIPVGSDVSLISHPDKEFYHLTRGCVSRYSLNGASIPLNMSITADFSKGSSGGPVFDEAGNVAGMVVSTKSVAFAELKVVLDATNSCLRRATRDEIRNAGKLEPERRPYTVGFDHQMTFKDCVPVSSIRKLITP